MRCVAAHRMEDGVDDLRPPNLILHGVQDGKGARRRQSISAAVERWAGELSKSWTEDRDDHAMRSTDSTMRMARAPAPTGECQPRRGVA